MKKWERKGFFKTDEKKKNKKQNPKQNCIEHRLL
jgi:hypothetical protein